MKNQDANNKKKNQHDELRVFKEVVKPAFHNFEEAKFMFPWCGYDDKPYFEENELKPFGDYKIRRSEQKYSSNIDFIKK